MDPIAVTISDLPEDNIIHILGLASCPNGMFEAGVMGELGFKSILNLSAVCPLWRRLARKVPVKTFDLGLHTPFSEEAKSLNELVARLGSSWLGRQVWKLLSDPEICTFQGCTSTNLPAE